MAGLPVSPANASPHTSRCVTHDSGGQSNSPFLLCIELASTTICRLALAHCNGKAACRALPDEDCASSSSSAWPLPPIAACRHCIAFPGAHAQEQTPWNLPVSQAVAIVQNRWAGRHQTIGLSGSGWDNAPSARQEYAPVGRPIVPIARRQPGCAGHPARRAQSCRRHGIRGCAAPDTSGIHPGSADRRRANTHRATDVATIHAWQGRMLTAEKRHAQPERGCFHGLAARQSLKQALY